MEAAGGEKCQVQPSASRGGAAAMAGALEGEHTENVMEEDLVEERTQNVMEEDLGVKRKSERVEALRADCRSRSGAACWLIVALASTTELTSGAGRPLRAESDGRISEGHCARTNILPIQGTPCAASISHRPLTSLSVCLVGFSLFAVFCLLNFLRCSVLSLGGFL
jgi:hypothetical protein